MKVMSALNLRPRKLGSFEEYSLALSRTLTRQGHQSVLVFKELPSDAFMPQYLDAGAILETKPFEPFSRESATTLRALVQKHRPDVVHMHFVNLLSLDVASLSTCSGVKVVFSEHSSDIPKYRGPLHTAALRSSVQAFSSLLDTMVAPSNYVNARAVRAGVSARKVKTIYNGVNLEKFRNASVTQDIRAKYGIGRDSVIVVSIAKLIPDKGIQYLIEAAGQVLAQGADVSFIHIGDGPCEAEYKARIQQLGIEKHFTFAGLLNLPQVADIMRQSDVFTLPCTWGEAFSLVILEAMSTGTPAIVTNVGGNMEAVEHGCNGLVIPPHDSAALAAAIRKLHDNPALRKEMGRESLARSNYFDVQRWVDESIDLYTRLTGGTAVKAPPRALTAVS
jgi:glycosyltransferase involved in cell wall biosynthesis